MVFQKEYDVNFPGKGSAKVILDKTKVLGEGASGKIYEITYLQKRYAAKIFAKSSKKIQNKINLMIDMQDKVVNDKLVWPVATLQTGKTVKGFLMPMIDPSEYFDLDIFYDPMLKKKLPNEKLTSLPLIFKIIKNFSTVIKFLHTKKIYIVDLKPHNIKVSSKDLSIKILDCDSFYINDEYPADMVSAGYISPEAIRGELKTEKLGEAQDKFAMAVIIFQLLNRGVHPFQGILTAPSASLASFDQKTGAELYAYSRKNNPKIKAHPLSIHRHFPAPLLEMFEDAFTGSETDRPTAQDWLLYAQKLLKEKYFKYCKTNKTNDHIHFSYKSCFTCYLDGIKATNPIKKGNPIKPQSKPQTILQSSPPKEKSNVVNFLLFFLLIFLFIFMMFIN